jgi:dihydroxyacetone kinase
MSVTALEVKNTVDRMCDVIIENEKYFCDLDSAAGDGDFGMSLANGFRAVKKQIDDLDDDSVFKFLRGCSMLISEYCGGASGPIWGSAFGAAAKSAKEKTTLELADVALMFEDAVAAIQQRGGAKIGDKTLLDALIPATETLRRAADGGKSVKEAFTSASEAAAAGAEATKAMVASKGRATYVGERSLNHPDAGAMAVDVLFRTLTEQHSVT